MRILIVLHDNSLSQATLQMGSRLSRKNSSPLTVLTVLSNIQLRPKADQLMGAARQMTEPGKLKTVLRFGHPIKEILAETRAGRYELVVIDEESGQKQTPLPHDTNISSTLLNQIRVPALFVQGRVRDLHKILLCDSGGDETGTLSRFTANLTECLDAVPQITVLHVMSQISSTPGAADWSLMAEAEQLIQELTPEGVVLERDLQVLKQTAHPITPKIRHGFVIDEILSEAQEGDYDLLVIGAHRKEMWQRLLLEDIAQELLRRADRPVLIVK